jgi:N-acetylneuraminic acid mutarotase
MLFRTGLSILSVSLLTFYINCSNPVSSNKDPDPVSVTIWYHTNSVDVDSTTQLTGVVLYSDSTKDSNVTWSSSNTEIAEISSTGKVLGIAKGKFTITVKSAVNPAISSSFNMSVEMPISWISKASMINSRDGVTLCVLNGKIYAIGGTSSLGAIGNIEEYDPVTDKWKEKSVNIGSHSNVTAVTLGSKIYILRDSSSSNMSFSAYDPITDSLYPKSALSSSIFWFGICAANDKIYVIGGASGSSKYSRTNYGTGSITATATASVYLNSTFEYDTSNDTWREKATIPVARSHIALASLNGKIYAIGGHNANYIYSRVDVFDPELNTWSDVTFLPLYRWGATSTILNGHIFVIGGIATNTYVSNSIFEYDPEGDSWSMRTPLSDVRLNLGACALDSAIFIAGGWNAQGYLSTTLGGSF